MNYWAPVIAQQPTAFKGGASTLDSTPMLFESDLIELHRLKHVMRLLRPIVELFRARAPHCGGTCEPPEVILRAEQWDITCCAFWLASDRVEAAKVLEREVRRRIERAADNAMSKSAAQVHRQTTISGLQLGKSQPRNFTGTAVARKRALAKTPEEDIIRRAMDALHGDDEDT